MENSSLHIAYKTSTITLIINLVLSIFKLIAGIVGRSNAMISDAVHSASDVGSTIIVMIGVKIASKQADKKHQYGHDKFECIAAIILSALLFATAIGIGYNGLKQILHQENITTPGIVALSAAVISIAVKEWMYWYTKAAAKKINSGALMADAWHHRSDALSSVGSLIGIGGALLGFSILEPIASILICVLIVKAAFDIVMKAFEQIVDTAADDAVIEEIEYLVLSIDGVMGIDLLHTRMHANMLYVDIEIAVDGAVNLFSAHQVAENVHDILESKIPTIKHCMVHVNPYKNLS